MANGTERTVTISADYFAELHRKANETDNICKECREEHTAEEFNALCIAAVKDERNRLNAKVNELMKKLDDAAVHYCTNATGKLGDACKVAAMCRENEVKLAAAERCIEDIDQIYSVWNSTAKTAEESMFNIVKIIRAYREKKEAK